MSAFICTDTHINAIVTWAAINKISSYYGNPGKSWFTYQNEQATTELFYAANVVSVNYRYKLSDPVGTIIYKPTGLYRPIAIIKLCTCLAYQSCEYPTWGDSIAKRLLDEIRRVAITKLPGYEEAPWSI